MTQQTVPRRDAETAAEINLALREATLVDAAYRLHASGIPIDTARRVLLTKNRRSPA